MPGAVSGLIQFNPNGKSRIEESLRQLFQQSTKRYHREGRDRRGLPFEAALDHYEHASVDRIAVSRALKTLGLLTITKRTITPPIPKRKAANFS